MGNYRAIGAAYVTPVTCLSTTILLFLIFSERKAALIQFLASLSVINRGGVTCQSKHHYKKPGNPMKVRKAVTCKWLLCFILFSQAFISRAQLAANFSATPVSGCAPLLVNFTDLSTGNPTSWKWDLGNGTTSFLRNPAVTYFAPGQYNVKLVVTNANGSNETVKSQFITVYGVPVINFVGSPHIL